MSAWGLMTPPPGQGQANAWLQMVPLLVIFAIFYFLLIRPQRTRQKQVQKMLESLKSGDKVVTSGGMLGTVVGIDRGIVQLREATEQASPMISEIVEILLREMDRPPDTDAFKKSPASEPQKEMSAASSSA